MDAHGEPTVPPEQVPPEHQQPPTSPPPPPAATSPETVAVHRDRRVLVGSVAAAFIVGGAVGGGTVAIAGAGSGSGSDTAQSIQGGLGQLPGAGMGTADGSGEGTSSGGDNTAYGQTSTTVATTAQAAGVVIIDTGTDDGEAAGTGLVLTSSGEVVTNAHVVAGATTIRVTVATTGDAYAAKVLGESTTSDIAVLQLVGASGLTTATLDDDGDLAVGDDVTAVGNAEGQGVLVAAAGDVEQLDASITTSAGRGETSESLTGLVAVDADVVAGDSGGPLLDDAGEVVGIDTAATSGTFDVTGYTIPIDDVLTVVHRILEAVDAA